MKQPIDRIAEIIELLSLNLPGLSVTQIGRQLDIPVSAAHRIATLLANRGLLTQDSETRDFRLSLRFAAIGLRLLAGASFHNVVQPILEKYAGLTGELVRLAIAIDEGELTWVANAQGARTQLRVDPVAGHRAVPHLTAAGKAWLAAHDDATVARMLRLEQKRSDLPVSARGTSAADLRKSLTSCRKLGYAFAIDEIEVGLTAVAAVVSPPGSDAGVPVAAVSVAGPTVRINNARVREFGVLMIRASREIAEVWDLLGSGVRGSAGPARP